MLGNTVCWAHRLSDCSVPREGVAKVPGVPTIVEFGPVRETGMTLLINVF